MQRVDLGQDFLLIVPSGSPLAASARLSLHAVLGEVVAQISDYRSRSSPFDEWLNIAVEMAEPSSRETTGALFSSYLSFCSEAAVRHTDVLSLTAFGRRLTDMGLGKIKGGDGRVLRLGCALLIRAFDCEHRQSQTVGLVTARHNGDARRNRYGNEGCGA